MSPLDKMMFRTGLVRTSVVAKALGVQVSTIIRRVDRGHYHAERAGSLWYVRLDDVYTASDTSEIQRETLKLAVEELQGRGKTLVEVFAAEDKKGA